MYRQGYEATGIKEIAEASGILKGSFYNYFSSKEEFAKALIDAYGEQTYAFHKEMLSDRSKSPARRLEKLFDAIWHNMSEQCEYGKGCFLGNCSQEIGDTNPTLSRMVDQSFRKTKGLFVECLKEAQDKGELDQSQDPELLAEFLVNSWQGVMLRAKTAKSDEALKSFKEQIFNRLLR